MSMIITLKTQMFRGDWDQARSQYALLWFMEAMCRVNQSHIRQFKNMAERGLKKPYPRVYRSGVHYERERGTEEWLDIPNILAGGSYPGEFAGPWDDCLPLSTLVVRDDYSLVPIGSLAPGDRIMADGNWTTVLEWMDKGVKPVLAFDLDNGAILRCTAEHRLFLADGSERKAGEVRPGDQLYTPRVNFPTKPEPHLYEKFSAEDFAWLMGTYIADGWHNLPRHPRFAISGKDGHPKEKQKDRVLAMMEKAGINTYWNERYLGVNNRPLAEVMATCGSHAPDKRLPFMDLDERQVRSMLEGLAADATVSSGQLTYGTTSQALALQIRLLYRMLGQSTHIRRWDDHGGLGTNPIYRVGVRRPESEVAPQYHKKSARVRAVREDGNEHVCDIETDSKKFYLPESDLVVHNCEGLACWRVAELRELDWHWEVPRLDQKTYARYIDHIDSAYPPPPGASKMPGGIKAKPFAKFKQRDDSSFAYHALTLLPDGRLEDPSLTMGMTWEKDFHDRDIARKYQDGTLPIQIRYADIQDVVIVDPESPTGYSSNINKAKHNAGLTDNGMHGYEQGHPEVTNASPQEVLEWGRVNGEGLGHTLKAADHRALAHFTKAHLARRSHLGNDIGFRSGRLGRLGRIGQPEANWANRFGHIANAISIPPFTR